MRRSDRQVCDFAKIRAILDRCKVMRLAMVDGDKPYLVPLNFGYRLENERLTLFFHCAKEGRKLDLLRQNSTVCAEMDCGHALTSGGKVACQYGYLYQCILAEGKAVELTDPAQKIHALQVMMHQQTGRIFAITELQADAVSVWRIDVRHLSAKARYV